MENTYIYDIVSSFVARHPNKTTIRQETRASQTHRIIRRNNLRQENGDSVVSLANEIKEAEGFVPVTIPDGRLLSRSSKAAMKLLSESPKREAGIKCPLSDKKFPTTVGSIYQSESESNENVIRLEKRQDHSTGEDESVLHLSKGAEIPYNRNYRNMCKKGGLH